MKKLSILSALLLSATVIFMGCKTPVNPEDDDKVDQTVDRVVLSDGIWNAKVQGSTSTSIGTSSGSIPVTMLWNVKFSVSNNVGTARSGTMTITVKTSDILGPSYAAYTALTPAQKEAINTQYKEAMSQVYSASGTVKTATMDDNNLTLEIEMNSTALTGFNSNLNFSGTYTSGTVIKTNKKKTKYEMTVPQSQGTTLTCVLTKD